MLQVSRKTNLISFEISSEMHLVEHTIREAVKFLGEYSITDTSRFRLVLREMLNNAIEHGNSFNAEKKITLIIAHIPPPPTVKDKHKNYFQIEMEDEGLGFDYNTLDYSLPEDPKHINNRGFLLIHALSEKITFNQKGNKVSVTISCSDEEDMFTSYATPQNCGLC